MFFILFFTILFITVIHYVRNKLAPKEIGNIPYVSGWPMMWAMIRQRPHDEVEEVMSKASGEHEIYSTQFGGYKQVNVVGPDCIKDLLTASEDVVPKLEYQPGTSFHKFFGQGLPFSNGLLWKTYRNIATPAFNSSSYPGFAGDGTFELFEFLQERLNQKVNIFQTLQRVTIEILGKMAFGYQFGCLKSDETPHIIQLYQYIIAYVESPLRIMLPFINNLPLESNRKFDEALKEFDKFMFDIVEKKRSELKKHQENPSTEELRDDLLTKILELSEKEGVYASTKQLRDELVNFFVAGHDTTAMALSISLYYLAKYPEMQNRARAEVISILGEKPVTATPEQLKEMKYLLAVIKESLRILPPTPIVNLRRPTKPIKVGNYVIPKDVLCLVNIWQAHHDPKYWENPHQYNPERFLNNEKRHQYSWVPFSAGPRNCIGQNFSLMEQRVILSMILQKYELTLPKNTINKEKILLEPNFLLRPIKLELIFNERK